MADNSPQKGNGKDPLLTPRLTRMCSAPTGVEKDTASPSTLCIAVMTRLSLNFKLSMPSKHFLRCGCTRVGSFVSDRISSISSLDKKKNLHKKHHRA